MWGVMLLGIPFATWLIILQAAPGVINAVKGIAPPLADLFKEIEQLAQKLGSHQAALHVIAANPYASTQDWNSWAEVMRPDLVQGQGKPGSNG
jgi:hypothetical protein